MAHDPEKYLAKTKNPDIYDLLVEVRRHGFWFVNEDRAMHGGGPPGYYVVHGINETGREVWLFAYHNQKMAHPSCHRAGEAERRWGDLMLWMPPKFPFGLNPMAT